MANGNGDYSPLATRHSPGMPARAPAVHIPVCAMNRVRLGVNIDHVATIREARGVAYPDPARAAVVALEARG